MPGEAKVNPPRLGSKFIAAAGLLLGIAATLAPPEGAPAEGWASRIWVPLPEWLVITAVAGLSLASLIFLVMVLPWRRRRRKKGEDDYELYREPQRIPPALAALLLILALLPGVILGGALVWLGRNEVAGVSRSGGHMTVSGQRPVALLVPTSPDEPARPTSPVTTGLIGALALLAGGGGLGFVLWLFFGDRLRRYPADVAEAHAPLAIAIEEGLHDLRREPDARVAIVRIYGSFERALAGASLPRRPSQTPTEYMRTALGRLPLPAAAVRGLTALFELARFSEHPIGAEQRENAWHHLIDIRAALARGIEARNAATS